MSQFCLRMSIGFWITVYTADEVCQIKFHSLDIFTGTTGLVGLQASG